MVVYSVNDYINITSMVGTLGGMCRIEAVGNRSAKEEKRIERKPKRRCFGSVGAHETEKGMLAVKVLDRKASCIDHTYTRDEDQ